MMNIVPRPTRPALVRPADVCHVFNPSLIVLGSPLSGWKPSGLTTVEADPHRNPQCYHWARVKFRLELDSGEAFTFTAYPWASSFPWPEIGDAMHVFARFKRDNGVDTPSSQLLEIRHETTVTR